MNTKRAALLDIFRCILCLGVVVYHYIPDRPSSGPFMVNGFLVMSGFLLGCSFTKQGTFECARFFDSKVKRLLPMLLLTVVISLSIALMRGNFSMLLPASLLKFDLVKFLMNCSTPLWYMGVELSLLMFAPLFWYLFQNKYALYSGLIIMTSFTAYRFMAVPENTIFGGGLYFSTLARCWQFMGGLVSASIIYNPKHSRIRNIISSDTVVWPLFCIFCATAVTLMILKQSTDLHYWNYTFSFDLITTLLYMVLVPALYSRGIHCHPSITKCLTYAAGLTYPIFLIHVLIWLIVYCIIKEVIHKPSELIIGLCAALFTLILSVMMLKLDNLLKGHHN